MPNNVGYLTADTSPASDEVYTPQYAIKPLIRYIDYFNNDQFIETPDRDMLTIWCPFDEEDSNFVIMLREAGFKVIRSHIKDGQDFFTYEPDEPYDLIVSNPPFSLKDKILKRLDELNKPYAMLLPLPTLQGQKRFEYVKKCQAIIFDKRINYYKNKETKEIQKGVAFASIYLCKDFLHRDLVFEKLEVQ